MLEDRRRILVVDDEQNIRESLRLLLKQKFEVSTAPDGVEALEIIERERPDLVLLDVVMPRLDGIETLQKIKERDPSIHVVMLTATNTVKTAVSAMKFGATDYLNKPFDIEELTALLALKLSDAELAKTPLETVAPTGNRRSQIKGDFGPMVGRAPAMCSLFEKVEQLAARDTTVLIQGESGTGKELIAHQIHDLSPRANKPFVALNCGAIPETLIESELFGHEKGAFTSAVEKRLGHCELADGGTLFLDEIGELTLPVQVKLLRFLQEQEFYRVGRSKPVKVDVRIIAATNRSLEQLVAEGKFRQDLFYRINVIALQAPALRDRFEDIGNLLEHFVRKLAPLYGGKQMKFSEEAVEKLVQYDWPGNVRELENVVESLLALSSAELISVELLPQNLQAGGAQLSLKLDRVNSSGTFTDAERSFETEIILKALRKTNFVQTKAAEILGISRRILKYKMDKLGISEKLVRSDDSNMQ